MWTLQAILGALRRARPLGGQRVGACGLPSGRKMLKRAVCCFANVQEGRNPQILRDLAEAASSVPGAWLVRVFSDRTFDRSGLCILGEHDAVGDAVVAMVTKALDHIDLTSAERRGNERIHHHIGSARVPQPRRAQGTRCGVGLRGWRLVQRVTLCCCCHAQVPSISFLSIPLAARPWTTLRQSRDLLRRGLGET